MPTREEIVATARQYLETPFHHQGRIKGVGIDCIGLVICVAHDVKISTYDIIDYGHSPHAQMMRRVMLEHLDPITIDDIKDADIVHMVFDSEPQHVAIIAGKNIIHAYAKVRKCVEHELDSLWRSRVRGAYRFRGLTE